MHMSVYTSVIPTCFLKSLQVFTTYILMMAMGTYAYTSTAIAIVMSAAETEYSMSLALLEALNGYF